MFGQTWLLSKGKFSLGVHDILYRSLDTVVLLVVSLTFCDSSIRVIHDMNQSQLYNRPDAGHYCQWRRWNGQQLKRLFRVHPLWSLWLWLADLFQNSKTRPNEKSSHYIKWFLLKELLYAKFMFVTGMWVFWQFATSYNTRWLSQFFSPGYLDT